jgi:hypothetical protein
MSAVTNMWIYMENILFNPSELSFCLNSFNGFVVVSGDLDDIYE